MIEQYNRYNIITASRAGVKTYFWESALLIRELQNLLSKIVNFQKGMKSLTLVVYGLNTNKPRIIFRLHRMDCYINWFILLHLANVTYFFTLLNVPVLCEPKQFCRKDVFYYLCNDWLTFLTLIWSIWPLLFSTKRMIFTIVL